MAISTWRALVRLSAMTAALALTACGGGGDSGSSSSSGGGSSGSSSPASSYALTVVGGNGSGNYAPGASVSISAYAPGTGQSFNDWTGGGISGNAATTSSTSFTMPAANTTLTAHFVGAGSTIPYPVSGHPRLWLTAADLPTLRSWAVSTNPVYQSGMVPLLTTAVNTYTQDYFPGGIANPTYPDDGDTQGYSSTPISEQLGMVLAFNSLIDPSSSKRILYAQYARNLLMVAMNQAVLGHAANLPFRDPAFAIYNRANGSGESWPLIVDWIYNTTDGSGNPILSSSDKATIRKVFMIWANDCLNASTTGGDHPEPIGTTNSTALLPNNLPYRMASNNYYLGHARLLTMMALSMDPQDDPALDSSVPVAQLGNSLRSYILDANGAWLYQEYAMYGEGATVASDYGISGGGTGFGLASGGLPPEGMLYGHSYNFLMGQLMALQTAGFNDATASGPQIGLIGTPMWDRYVTGFISSLVPAAKTFSDMSYLGPVYQFGSYGDLLRLWATPDFMQSFALLALLENRSGNTTHLNAARWFALNAAEGGSGYFYNRISNPWSYSATSSLLYFMLFDPSAPTPTDPRPGFASTRFFDPAAGRIVAHSDWTASGSMFDYRASFESINHQNGDGGQFELYRKGEWLTKEMSNYDANFLGQTTPYHNTLALQNWSAAGTPDLSWFESGEWTNGSQWILDANAGDPTTAESSGSNYVYASSVLTPLYDRPDQWTPSAAATDITLATRSILWLNNDYIVVYDRASSNHSGFKRFNLCLVTTPTISGNTATETLASGQKLYMQTLLPSTNLSISSVEADTNLTTVADEEPTKFIMTVEDTSHPTNTRFLHVLQGADSGTAMVAASHLASSSGTAFDGAVFGSNAVYFPVANSSTISAGTTLMAPTGVHTLWVAGLVANGKYAATVSAVSGGNNISLTASSSGSAVADGAGLLQVTF